MFKKLASALAVAAVTAFLPAQASADNIRLGILTCEIDGGTGLVIASHKGISCTYKSSRGGGLEYYTGIISKIGVDLGITQQGTLQWAVLAVEGRQKEGALGGDYLGATAEASLVTGGGANLLVGGFKRSFTLQPLSVQAQTGVNLALTVTSMKLIHSLK